jgi:hypothetical protein
LPTCLPAVHPYMVIACYLPVLSVNRIREQHRIVDSHTLACRPKRDSRSPSRSPSRSSRPTTQSQSASPQPLLLREVRQHQYHRRRSRATFGPLSRARQPHRIRRTLTPRTSNNERRGEDEPVRHESSSVVAPVIVAFRLSAA